MYPSLSLLSAHFLVKPFISETGTPVKVSEAEMALATKAALILNGIEKCGQQGGKKGWGESKAKPTLIPKKNES